MEARSDATETPHVDADVLALIALGEPIAEVSTSQHLAGCADCQREIAALRSTVTVARATVGEAALSDPPEHVWQSIRGELGLSDTLEPSSRPAAVASPASVPSPVVDLSSRRERRSSIRRTIALVVASAAAAAVVTGGVIGWVASAPRAAEAVLASAALDALPDWPEATGSATLAQRADGERVLRVTLDQAVEGEVVREVWLLTPNVDGLISLGYLTGDTGEFVVPDSVDIDRYSVVDVSAEPVDGDPAHSGDSIVRGSLDV